MIQMFLVDLLSQTLQNFLVTMLVETIPDEQCPNIQKDHKHVLGVQPEI
jgi:hypothetical protein